MEEFFQVLGVIGLITLLVAGTLAGLIASMLEDGRHKTRNIAIGVVGAVAVLLIAQMIFR